MEKTGASATSISWPAIDAAASLNIWFALTALAGAVSEYFGQPYLAAGAMILYVAYGVAMRRSVPNVERLADATYYQGFILTIFALLLALTGGGAKAITSDVIIQQFGLAIVTTFVGMTCRIMILQFLTSATDEDDALRQTMADYVGALQREIETTLPQFQAFRDDVIASAGKIADDLAGEAMRTRRDTEEAAKSATETMVRSVQAVSGKLDEAVERLVWKIDRIDIPADTLSQQIRLLTDGWNDELAHVRAELSKGAQSLAETLRADLGILHAIRADFEAIKATLSQANAAIAESARVTAGSLDTTRASLAAAGDAVRGLEQLGRTAAELSAQLGGFSSALSDRAGAYTSDIRKASAEMAVVATQVVGDADRLSRALLDGTRKLTQAVKEAGRTGAGVE